MPHKIAFVGEILSVQPRSNVWRYRLDNRTHNLTGFNLFLRGAVKEANTETDEPAERDFSVAISGGQQEKNHFRIGDRIKGTAWTKKYPEWEFADYYRAGGLKRIHSKEAISVLSADRKAAGPETIHEKEKIQVPPPWTDDTPELSVYAWRGCRMLSKSRWKGKCFTCKWAAMANVAIEYDWGVQQKYRFESFCYGPKNCKRYSMGKPRAVPDKQVGTCYDEGWLDEICTERRGEEV